MQEQQYLPVNWTDGMKINQSHFIAQDNAATFQLAQNTAAFLNECNYGLSRAAWHKAQGTKIYLSVDNQQQVQVRLQACHALTRGGYCIQFDEGTTLEAGTPSPLLNLSAPFQDLREKASSYYIVISIDPYRRIPYGLAELEEMPPRLPYLKPAYELSLVAVKNTTANLLGLHQVPVGQLLVDEYRVVLNDHYIPPCCTIGSHFELLEIHAGLEQFYAKMELYSLQIIQKILQKKQVNDMAGIVHKLCENITMITASHLADVRTLSVNQPPVYLINKVSSMARSMKNTLDYFIGSGKEEFVNYCAEWCNSSQGEIEGSITGLTNHVYDHLNINASIEKISGFTKAITGLFSALARLDYIGKRKDAGIFVKEKIVVTEPEEPRKRRSFLAD